MRRKFQAFTALLAGGACLLLLAADSQASFVSTAKVKGSKGYSISVTGSYAVILSTSKNTKASQSGASYQVLGKFTKKKIKATYKGLGKVNLKFKPKGKAKKVPPPKRCKGPSSKVQRGTWVGKIKFTGEGRYTKVNAKKANGNVTTTPDRGLTCKPPKPKPPRACWSAAAIKGATTFTAVQRQGQKPTFTATTMGSSSKGVGFTRFVTAKGGQLKVDDAAGTGLLAPPAPFKGKGNIADSVLRGGLKVKFPGANVKMAGSGAHVWTATCTD